jgi:hypothetical protein
MTSSQAQCSNSFVTLPLVHFPRPRAGTDHTNRNLDLLTANSDDPNHQTPRQKGQNCDAQTRFCAVFPAPTSRARGLVAGLTQWDEISGKMRARVRVVAFAVAKLRDIGKLRLRFPVEKQGGRQPRTEAGEYSIVVSVAALVSDGDSSIS